MAAIFMEFRYKKKYVFLFTLNPANKIKLTLSLDTLFSSIDSHMFLGGTEVTFSM